ncbi:hypothetical protein [Piscirickettsia salmonis]|nr:hypothetical protein [Piscirickettsia salmonis]
MECADSRHVTLCDADSRGFIVVAFCSAILHSLDVQKYLPR